MDPVFACCTLLSATILNRRQRSFAALRATHATRTARHRYRRTARSSTACGRQPPDLRTVDRRRISCGLALRRVSLADIGIEAAVVDRSAAEAARAAGA